MRTEPTLNQFDIAENKFVGIAGKRIGERVRGVMNYTCVEKTKSFTMIRISMIIIMQTKRAF